MLEADAADVPAWVKENIGRRSDANENAFRLTRPVLVTGGKIRAWPEPHIALPTGAALYLLDGPTFPVADGGSAVKAGLMSGLAAAVPLFGVAAHTDGESLHAYDEVLRGVGWLPTVDYYSGAHLSRVLKDLNPHSVIVDSLETATRALESHPRRIVLLLMDFYPKLLKARSASADEQQLALRRMQRLAADDSVTVVTRTEDDRADVLALKPAREPLLYRGADLGTARPVRLDQSGPAAVLGNYFYPPNATGLLKLARFARPHHTFRVIGAVPDRLVSSLRSHSGAAFEFVGMTDDLNGALDGVAVGLVPLDLGGGSSVKVLDYCARNIPVIATEVGARGLTAHLRDSLFVVPQIRDIPTTVDLLSNLDWQSRIAAAQQEIAREYGAVPASVFGVVA